MEIEMIFEGDGNRIDEWRATFATGDILVS
jgi:hypothetical protein